MTKLSSKQMSEVCEKHVLSMLRGMGGVAGFVKNIDRTRLMAGYRMMTPRQAIGVYIHDGNFLIYNADIIKFLTKLGFTPRQIDNATYPIVGYGTTDGALALYAKVLTEPCFKLYADYKKKHPEKR